MSLAGGSYMPSFFEMELETDGPIDLNKEDEIGRSVFIHEYVHFLQDILTTYGLYNIYAIGELMLSCVKQITRLQLGDFDTPLNFEEDNQDNVQLQITVNEYTIGELDPNKLFVPSIVLKKVDKKQTKLLIRNNYIEEIEQIILETNIGELHFGAREIKESMAYLIQKECCENVPHHDDFPYKVATIIANRYDKHFANSSRKVVALCEMSLMSSNPGKTFINTLEQLRAKRLVFKTVQDVYYYFRQCKLKEAGTNKILSVKDGYSKISSFAFDHLKEYFRGESLYDPVTNWINNLQAFGNKAIRTEDHVFITIIDKIKKRDYSYLRSIIDSNGGPLMINTKGERFLFPNVPDLSPLSAVKQIYRIFKYGDNQCALVNWCKNSNNNNVTKDCPYTPWLRADDASTMCPFSMLWRKWGLSGHNPV